VKTAAYRPDWLDEDRLRYTDRLAAILTALLPSGVAGTINTIGGAFRARVRSRVDDAAIADRLLRHVALLVELHRKTGKVVTLALEPEPACRLETIGETIEFFDRHLYARGAVARVGALTRLDATGSIDAIRRHLGVCLDAGHVAVEFEEPLTALRALAFAGVPVAKIQPTAALRVRNPYDPQVRRALQALAGDDCLHQVVARAPAACSASSTSGRPRRAAGERRRVAHPRARARRRRRDGLPSAPRSSRRARSWARSAAPPRCGTWRSRPTTGPPCRRRIARPTSSRASCASWHG
jgi:hypothetical protein